MKKIKVTSGVYWIEIPEADLYLQCGCIADSVKHLMKKGLILDEEKKGVFCETGPNAVLLSDVFMQQERFTNMAEFSVLQMLYRQGMILPGHPNNTGEKPILIGNEAEVNAQVEYIYRGNYGLTSVEEIMAAGIPEEQAKRMMSQKLMFAFGKIRDTREFIETRVVGSEPVEIKNKVFIRREELNIFQITYRGESIQVNLNLAAGESYQAPYSLDYHKIPREYFSVIHNGEGDGWDINRPCMGSILIFQGRIYLVDCGPNIMNSLEALGIGVNEIDGIFHTHAHDDHFSGITELIRADHRIKYFSTRLVRSSVTKKLVALTSIDEALFDKYFAVHDLEVDKWNNVQGLEVRPVYSPHPVETCIMFFRTLWGDGYKSYAHLADITSFSRLGSVITKDNKQHGITAKYFNKVKEAYLTPACIKKIDVGGGLIHGDAEDFINDKSKKILFSHNSLPLTDQQKEIGNNANFGVFDVIIPAQQDYTKRLFYQYFQSYFPTVPEYEINMLLNNPVTSFNPGAILMKKGELNTDVFFILSGILEYIEQESGLNNKLMVGSMAGELSGITGTPLTGTYRAVSYVKALQVSCNLYSMFLIRNNIIEDFKKNINERYFLQNTWLFGERVSCPQKSRIAQAMMMKTYKKGEFLPVKDNGRLYLLYEGEISVLSGDRVIEKIAPGAFFGEESIMNKEPAKMFAARAEKKSRLYVIPECLTEDIPIVHWKLLEVYKTRLLR